MSKTLYSSAWVARAYAVLWRRFTVVTLAQTLALVDIHALEGVAAREGRPPRMLDVACGVGELLEQMLARLPTLEAYGVDSSEAMLIQARQRLASWPRVRLTLASSGVGPSAQLPYAPGFFDLITCTNALHYLSDPSATVAGLATLLAPGGQLVVEDYATRDWGARWRIFEGLIRRVDPQHVRTYTLAEALALAAEACLRIDASRAFVVNWLCHGWVFSHRNMR